MRTKGFSVDEFLQRGVKPLALAGWLLPFFRAYNGFLPDRASVMGYQGVWVVPALLGGFAALVTWRRRPADPGGHADMTVKAFIVSVGACAVLLVLALGGEAPFYRRTYGIPIWSSLRWPFKFFLFSQPALLLAATLGLELWTRDHGERQRPRWIPVLLFLAMAALAGWKLNLVPLGGRGETLGLLAACVTLASLPYLDRHWTGTAAMLLGSFASAVALTANAHDMGMKTYVEPYGKIGAEHLGVSGESRVLPITTQRFGHPVMQPLALLHSATANAYDSATGTQAGLIPEWFEDTLSVDVFGVPRQGTLEVFLRSHMLRSFNVGHLVVAAGDRAARGSVEATGGFTLLREGKESATYRTNGVLPRAYFSSRTYRHTPQGLHQGMWLNGARVDSAFVEGWSGPEAVAVGRVVHAAWDADRATIEVDAPAGGFLVLSVSFYPGWTCAIDGRPTRLERVNRRLMGVVVPPGARRVSLESIHPLSDWASSWHSLRAGCCA